MNTGFYSLDQAISAAVDKTESAFKVRDRFTFSTGYQSLDQAIGGLPREGLIFLASEPNSGRRALALNIVERVVQRPNQGCLILTCGKSHIGGAHLLLSIKSGVNLQKLVVGKLGNDDWPRLKQAMRELCGRSLFFDTTTFASRVELRRSIRSWVNRFDKTLRLVVIDAVIDDLSCWFNVEPRVLCTALLEISKENNTCIMLRADTYPNDSDSKANALGSLNSSERHIIHEYADHIFWINRESLISSDRLINTSKEVIVYSRGCLSNYHTHLKFYADTCRFTEFKEDS